MSLSERVREVYRGIQLSVRQALFLGLLPRLAADRMALVRRLRIATGVAIPLSFMVVAAGLLFWNGKTISIGGLLLDMIGVMRLFLDEEWSRIITSYDETDYPFGPPSHVVREMFSYDNPEALGELEETTDDETSAHEMGRYYYLQRGLALIFLGFAFQFIGTLIS